MYAYMVHVDACMCDRVMCARTCMYVFMERGTLVKQDLTTPEQMMEFMSIQVCVHACVCVRAAMQMRRRSVCTHTYVHTHIHTYLEDRRGAR